MPLLYPRKSILAALDFHSPHTFSLLRGPGAAQCLHQGCQGELSAVSGASLVGARARWSCLAPVPTRCAGHSHLFLLQEFAVWGKCSFDPDSGFAFAWLHHLILPCCGFWAKLWSKNGCESSSDGLWLGQELKKGQKVTVKESFHICLSITWSEAFLFFFCSQAMAGEKRMMSV